MCWMNTAGIILARANIRLEIAHVSVLSLQVQDHTLQLNMFSLFLYLEI